MLGVKTQTLGQWRIKGIGPRFIRQTPRTVVYLRKSVNQWLEDHEQSVQVSYKLKKKKRPKRTTRADKASPESESPGA